MNSKIEKMARTGYVAKGVVYTIVGILTFLAAFNMGGEKAGQTQVVEFLDKQTFGNILLIFLSLGLLSYAAWRFTQAISDPEGIGNDKKAIGQRTAFFISGVSYLGLAVIGIMQVINTGGGSGSGDSPGEEEKTAFLASETGLIVLGIAGIIIMARGIYQFLRIYRNNFEKKFKTEAFRDEKKRRLIENTAYIGLTSRGVLFLIVGYFALQAALDSDPSQTKNTAEVFSFIEQRAYGAWLLGIVAAGLVGYGIYTFMMAKYRQFGK